MCRILYALSPVRQCRVDSCNKKGATGDHAHIIAMILLLVYLYSLLVLSVPAHQSRSYNPLSISQLKRVIQLGPPQFSSVTDGHLGKLLIPRPCMSFGTFLDFPSFTANIKISWIGKQVSCCTTN